MSEVLQHSGVLWSTDAYIFSKYMLLMQIYFIFLLQDSNLPATWMKMESQLKFLNKARTNTSNLFYSLSQCRKSSTSLLKSSAKRRCRLCFPSGIRSNLKREKNQTLHIHYILGVQVTKIFVAFSLLLVTWVQNWSNPCFKYYPYAHCLECEPQQQLKQQAYYLPHLGRINWA